MAEIENSGRKENPLQGWILVSVHRKTPILVDFLRKVSPHFKGIIASSGTANFLEDKGFAVKRVEEVTGFPESFDDRVKTINPKIEGGILFNRRNPEHQRQAERLGIEPIDIVICDPYNLDEAIRNRLGLSRIFENIDIGGPMAIVAAAKNCWDVIVVIDEADFALVGEELEKHGYLHVDTRRRLAEKAFRFVGSYYTMAADYIDKLIREGRD